MDPQHLARLDDDGRVRRSRGRLAGGPAATASPESPEVPVPAPSSALHLAGRRRARRSLVAGGASVVLGPDPLADAWPLPVAGDGPVLDDAWPLLDVDALQLAGAPDQVDDPAGAGVCTPAAVVAAVAAGPRHRRPGTSHRRPTVYLAAALIGAAGVGVFSTAGDRTPTAQADEPVSVAEELGMVQAEQAVGGDSQAAAVDQLRAVAASRAEREDAQAAAAQVQQQAVQVAADAAAAAAAEAARPKAVLPVQGATLSSGFGYRWGTLHAGLDFAAPLGTPEYAAMDGVVVRAGAASGFGLAVYIQHANGDVTVYGHMEKILVTEGQAVKAGDTIALLGAEGQSTGPHLHFEVHQGGMDGQRIDPLPWLQANGVQVP